MSWRAALWIALIVLSASARARAESRSVVIFGDTQKLTRQDTVSQEKLDGLAAMIGWASDPNNVENVDFVLHVGDIIEHGGELVPPLPPSCFDPNTQACLQGASCRCDALALVPREWANFRERWQVLEARAVPYAIVRGNHDNVGLPFFVDANTPYDPNHPLAPPGPQNDATGFEYFYGRDHFAALPGNVPIGTCDDAVAGPGHVWDFSLRFTSGAEPVRILATPDWESLRDANDPQVDCFRNLLESAPQPPTIALSHRHGPDVPFGRTAWAELVHPNPQVFLGVEGHFGTTVRSIPTAGGTALGNETLAIRTNWQHSDPPEAFQMHLVRFHRTPGAFDEIEILLVSRNATTGAFEVGGVEGQVGVLTRRPFSLFRDIDGDGIPDGSDLCPEDAEPETNDADGDGIGDRCDACPLTAIQPPGALPLDSDQDGYGNACDPCPISPVHTDSDQDGVPDACDSCVGVADPNQADLDFELGTPVDLVVGDVCTVDVDGDGIPDDGDGDGVRGNAACTGGASAACDDNCPYAPDATQADRGGVGVPTDPNGAIADGIGDVCQCGDVTDDGAVNLLDRDHIIEAFEDPNVELVAPDKCPKPPSPDPCHSGFGAQIWTSVHIPGVTPIRQSCGPAISRFPEDQDGDGVVDWLDNCPLHPHESLRDSDQDGVGDLCDNCPHVPNPRKTASFLEQHPWITVTGGQRDDDADGYGNVCDGKFAQGNFVSPLDTFMLKTALGQPTAGSGCGLTGDQPCARYDVNEDLAPIIGPLDTNHFVQNLFGRSISDPNTTCPACPLACEGPNCP